MRLIANMTRDEIIESLLDYLNQQYHLLNVTCTHPEDITIKQEGPFFVVGCTSAETCHQLALWVSHPLMRKEECLIRVLGHEQIVTYAKQQATKNLKNQLRRSIEEKR